MSTATGIVNTGGFSGAVAAILVVGVMLDLGATGESPTTIHGFRLGFLVVAGLSALAIWPLLRAWRRARARVLLRQGNGRQVPVQLRRRSWDTGPR